MQWDKAAQIEPGRARVTIKPDIPAQRPPTEAEKILEQLKVLGDRLAAVEESVRAVGAKVGIAPKGN